jgi:hypothetical protein
MLDNLQRTKRQEFLRALSDILGGEINHEATDQYLNERDSSRQRDIRLHFRPSVPARANARRPARHLEHLADRHLP